MRLRRNGDTSLAARLQALGVTQPRLNRLAYVRYRAPELWGFLATAAALAAAGCAGSGRSQGQRAAVLACPTAPPADWAVFAPDSAAAVAERLAGTYDLVSVTTTRGMEGGPRTVRLRLAVTDSGERTGVRGFGPDGRRLGFWDQPVTAYIGALGAGRPEPYVYRLRAGAFVQDERHLCNDCSATVYRLEAVGPSGLWGRWEHEFAGIRVKGRDGKWHARVAGRFCAYRAAADSVPGA